MGKLTRREFLKQGVAGAAGVAVAATFPQKLFAGAPYLKNKKLSKKVVVLGFDGMDPNLTRRFIADGDMPTFKRFLESTGNYSLLKTTLPPQSPVAWSSFISGTNPGGHGIFDFIHRDPKKFLPYLSTSRSYPGDSTIDIGKWSLPLKSGRVEMLRRGPVFWSILEEHGISTTVYKIPANFPIQQEGNSRVVSGMGTPDLLGSYGTFTYFTDQEVPGAKGFTGGRVVPVQLRDHQVRTVLQGPRNDLNNEVDSAEIEFTVHRDPWESVIKIEIQGHEVVLRQGEWSEWIPLSFEFMPMFVSVSGMVRIFAQEVHPGFRLYMSPINIDPVTPTLPICNPASFSKELSDVVGRFYTQGFPEDTKALSHGIFDSHEFLQQAKVVLHERLAAFEHLYDQFQDGFFFFYFSTIDQNSHMLWRNMHPSHPLYEPNASSEVKNALRYFYRKMDEVLKKTLSKVDDDTTLMILSDHGFAPFEREFHVSTWLVENGYTVVKDPNRLHDSKLYQNVDWSKTKAYALGLNGIYINMEGRDIHGAVRPNEVAALKREIIAKISQVRDHDTGKRVLVNAYDAAQIYHGPYVPVGPDIVLGYASGYRVSDESVLGSFPRGITGPRTDKWSADHCMDPSTVPGVLFSNRSITGKEPGLWDLAPSILNSFAIETPAEMDGRPVLAV